MGTDFSLKMMVNHNLSEIGGKLQGFSTLMNRSISGLIIYGIGEAMTTSKRELTEQILLE